MRIVFRCFTNARMKYIFLIISFFFPINLISQNLDVDQTVAYLNNTFKEFPNYNGPWTSYTTIYLTSKGELQMEVIQTAKTDFGAQLILQKKTNKIAINKIDIKESFETNHDDDPDYRIQIYPVFDGKFFRRNF